MTVKEQAVLEAAAAVRAEFALVNAARDRARLTAARWASIAGERERLLRLIVGADSMTAEVEAVKAIAQHLRDLDAHDTAEWMRDS